MRGDRLGRVGLTIALTLIFLAVSLIPRLSPPAYAAGNPSLPVPEDPMGQSPEQGASEIATAVDVRDGHLTVRVVDIWGPGRTPLVVRSYTNADELSTSSAGGWQFNHLLDILSVTSNNTYKVREPDGNRPTYQPQGDIHVKDVGTYSTITTQQSCTPPRPGDDSTCIWNGATVYYPKGLSRKFNRNSAYNETAGIPGLIVEERDANNNVSTFAWTTLTDQDRAYIASVTDPVGRVTTYSYEAYGSRTCVEYVEERGACLRWSQPYRVRTITDPYGRQATYTYNGLGQLSSVTNAAGRITSYAYDGTGLMTSLTNARGSATTFQWFNSKVTRATASDGTATAYDYTNGTRTNVTNARGHVSSFDVSNGDVTRTTDPLGNATSYSYDSRHNATQVTDARGNSTTFTYSSRNKVTQIVQASGSLNLTATLSWDSSDNLLSITNPRALRTDYTYSSTHNLTGVRQAVGTADEAFAQYTYTTWGGVASAIDPRGNTTSYAYTARRQLQSVIPPVGGTVSYTYNTVDDQVTMTDGNAAHGPPPTIPAGW